MKPRLVKLSKGWGCYSPLVTSRLDFGQGTTAGDAFEDWERKQLRLFVREWADLWDFQLRPVA